MTQLAKSKTDYATSSARWRAVVDRDPGATCFVYGVRTTKIYCRPSCPARLARRANVEFYDTPKQAEGDGYRPCKRCRPEELLPPPDPHIRMAQKACETLALAVLSGGEKVRRPTLHDLATEAGLTPSHFHRVFKKVVGVTPGKYARDVGDGKTMQHEVNSGFEPFAISCTVPSTVDSHTTAAAAAAAADVDVDVSRTQAQQEEIEQGPYPHVAIPTDWDEFDSMLAEASQPIPLDKWMGNGHCFPPPNACFDPTESALFDEPRLSSTEGGWGGTAAPGPAAENIDPWSKFTQGVGKDHYPASTDNLRTGRPISNPSPSSLESLSTPETPLNLDPHATLTASSLLLDDLNYLDDSMMFPGYDPASGAVQFRTGA